MPDETTPPRQGAMDAERVLNGRISPWPLASTRRPPLTRSSSTGQLPGARPAGLQNIATSPWRC